MCTEEKRRGKGERGDAFARQSSSHIVAESSARVRSTEKRTVFAPITIPSVSAAERFAARG